MKKFFLTVLFLFFLIVGGLGFFIIRSFNTDAFQKQIVESISEMTGREFNVMGATYVSWFPTPRIVMNDITLANIKGSQRAVMVRANRVGVELEWASLLKNPLVIKKIDIENQKQQLEADKQELDTSLAQAEQKRIELNSLKSDKEEEAEKLTAEEKELQKEIEELEAANRQISNAIREAEIKYQQQLEDLKNNGDTSLGSGYFIRPVSSGYISANGYYPSSGKFHGAIDYAVSTGTVVKAAADGVVMTTANLSTSYGTYVVIRHANGLQSYYAHGTRGSIVVKPGQTVKQGEKIMLSGNTGNSQGPHLHFEVRKSPYNYSYGAKAYGDDSRVNPNNYM